jgi:hypothetical protein
MKPINELKLSATIDNPGKLVTMQHNGQRAINSQVSFIFGKKNV